MRSFGQENSETFKIVGINAKNSEFHAAMGLCNLKYVDKILQKRKEQFQIYDFLLKNAKIEKQLIKDNTDYNYSYYPILFESENILLKVKKNLEKNNIFPRRYFYPALNTLLYLKNKQRMPVAEDISKRILCLPIYHGLKKKEQGRIVGMIKK